MLENNNLKICRKLVRREFQFHKGRSILLIAAITLVSMLCTFSFALGFVIRNGLLYSYRTRYGSTSHILYYGLNDSQAAAIMHHAEVKETVRLEAVGVLSDDMMEYRSVKLAAVSSDWAAATEAVPVSGRMPAADDEIALDELTMQSLGIPREEGTLVTLRWKPVDGREERTDTFRLCGWWSSDMGFTETCAWITPEKADRLCPAAADSVTLGVTLYRPDDLEKQAEELLADSGVDGVSFTTNLAYNEARLARADSQAAPYYRMNIVVAACGILMVHSIVRISARQNVRFYGRMKSLGMTPRQIRRLLLGQAAYLCFPAVPLGWLLGFALHTVVAPYVILNMDGRNPALLFFRIRPFVYSALLTCLTTLAACSLSVRFVSKISPAQAPGMIDIGQKRRRREYEGKHRRIGILRMALFSLTREKQRFVLAVCSLFLSLLLLCVLWTQYVSTDEEKYLENVAYSDYLVADASAATSYQRYNPWSRNITSQFMEALTGHEAVKGYGVIRTMEIPMYAGEEERALIVENFESENEDGIVRKEVMAGSPDWGAAYEKFRETGEYIGIVTGVDGLAQSVILEEGEYVEGSYDAARFATGNYVVASGASTTSFISTPPVGSCVKIGGRSFEIMASVSYQSNVITGSDSREAEFNISYVIPMQVYEALFPGSGIRNVLVDIDYNSQQAFEEFLHALTKDTGIKVTMRSDYQQDFRNALFHNYMIPMFVGMVLLLIGILNFGNTLVTGILIRGKELAIYESLGMTRAQIRRLLVLEGLIQGGAMCGILIPAVSALTWLLGRWWSVYSASSWCVTWRYSLRPMWAVLPLIAVMAVWIPACCLRVIEKESVTERLRVAE